MVGDPVERKRLLGKLKSEFEGMTAWLDPKKRRLMLKC